MAKRSKKQQEQGKSGPQLPRDPDTLHRVFGALHEFSQWLEGELEGAIGAARMRRLGGVRYVIQVGRFLAQRHMEGDSGCSAGTKIAKPTGLKVEADLALGLGYVDAGALNKSVGVIAAAVEALEPFEGERFLRRPMRWQGTSNHMESQRAAGAESEASALATLEEEATEMARVFRDVVARFAERVTSIQPGAKATKNEGQGMSPKQVAKRFKVSVDKVYDWIGCGELKAVDVASRGSSRRRWRISEIAVEEFEKKRQANAPPSSAKPRRKKDADGIIEFFPP